MNTSNDEDDEDYQNFIVNLFNEELEEEEGEDEYKPPPEGVDDDDDSNDDDDEGDDGGEDDEAEDDAIMLGNNYPNDNRNVENTGQSLNFSNGYSDDEDYEVKGPKKLLRYELQELVDDCWRTILGESLSLPDPYVDKVKQIADLNGVKLYDHADFVHEYELNYDLLHGNSSAPFVENDVLSASSDENQDILSNHVKEKRKLNYSYARLSYGHPRKKKFKSGQAKEPTFMKSKLIMQMFLSDSTASDLTVDGYPIVSYRKLIARQTAMASQLLIQLLLMAPHNSSEALRCTEIYESLKRDQTRSLNRASLIRLNLENLKIYKLNSMSNRISGVKSSSESVIPNDLGVRFQQAGQSCRDLPRLSTHPNELRSNPIELSNEEQLLQSSSSKPMAAVERILTRSSASSLALQLKDRNRQLCTLDIPILSSTVKWQETMNEALECRKYLVSNNRPSAIQSLIREDSINEKQDPLRHSDIREILSGLNELNSCDRHKHTQIANSRLGVHAALLQHCQENVSRICTAFHTPFFSCLLPRLGYPLSDKLVISLLSSSDESGATSAFSTGINHLEFAPSSIPSKQNSSRFNYEAVGQNIYNLIDYSLMGHTSSIQSTSVHSLQSQNVNFPHMQMMTFPNLSEAPMALPRFIETSAGTLTAEHCSLFNGCSTNIPLGAIDQNFQLPKSQTTCTDSERIMSRTQHSTHQTQLPVTEFYLSPSPALAVDLQFSGHWTTSQFTTPLYMDEANPNTHSNNMLEFPQSSLSNLFSPFLLHGHQQVMATSAPSRNSILSEPTSIHSIPTNMESSRHLQVGPTSFNNSLNHTQIKHAAQPKASPTSVPTNFTPFASSQDDTFVGLTMLSNVSLLDGSLCPATSKPILNCSSASSFEVKESNPNITLTTEVSPPNNNNFMELGLQGFLSSQIAHRESQGPLNGQLATLDHKISLPELGFNPITSNHSNTLNPISLQPFEYNCCSPSQRLCPNVVANDVAKYGFMLPTNITLSNILVDQPHLLLEPAALDYNLYSPQLACSMASNHTLNIQANVPPTAQVSTGSFLNELKQIPVNGSLKSFFTPAESELLIHGLMALKLYDWCRVSELFVPCKTSFDLVKHFHHMGSITTPGYNIVKEYLTLEQEVRRSRNAHWTYDEDLALLRGFHIYGSKWMLISLYFLPHRKRKEIKYRWTMLVRQIQDTEAKVASNKVTKQSKSSCSQSTSGAHTNSSLHSNLSKVSSIQIEQRHSTSVVHTDSVHQNLPSYCESSSAVMFVPLPSTANDTATPRPPNSPRNALHSQRHQTNLASQKKLFTLTDRAKVFLHYLHNNSFNNSATDVSKQSNEQRKNQALHAINTNNSFTLLPHVDNNHEQNFTSLSDEPTYSKDHDVAVMETDADPSIMLTELVDYDREEDVLTDSDSDNDVGS